MYHNTSYSNLVNIYIYNAAFQNDEDNHDEEFYQPTNDSLSWHLKK